MLFREKKQKQRLEIYQKAIEKQLHDDFQVNEYLNQNQLQGYKIYLSIHRNTQQYLKLLNSLIVNNQQKRKKHNTLQISFNQMTTDRLDKTTSQLSKVSNWENSKQSYMNKFQSTQIKISNQIEVKNTLWNEIVQTKKSINLLKGDIGHLVNRNQSANILSSKISKVKIIADDQLKRVTLAFSKDKDQIKQRKDMQQKFNKKLKNVSQFQNTSMNKLKETYMNVMVRKRRMHDRLAYIEKLSASIYQTEDKQREMNRINKETLLLYKNFQKLIKLIDKVPQLQEKYNKSQQTSIKDFMNQIINLCGIRNQKKSKTQGLSSRRSKAYASQRQPINSDDLQMINESNLRRFESIVKQQFERLSQQIQFKKIDYNSKMKMTEYSAAKLFEVNHEITKIQLHWLNEAISQYVETPSMKQQYFQKLNNFIYMIKTYQVLLEFIEKHLNYSAILSIEDKKISNEHQKEKVFSKTQTINMRKSDSRNRSLIFPTTHSSNKILPWGKSSSIMAKKSYISDLHKIYYALMREDESDFKLDDIDDDFFQYLGEDIQEWLNEIKQRINEGNILIKPSLYKSASKQQKDQTPNSYQSIIKRNRDVNNKKNVTTYIQSEEEQVIDIREQYENYIEDFNRRQIENDKENDIVIVRYNSAVNFNEKGNSFESPTSSFSHTKGMQQHSSHSKIANINKLKSLSKSAFLNSQKKAMRIKFLEGIDKDYYKMIKSTIQMEKQNTRKNYKFLKSFNRTKYESNDQILQEKRFQSSFSTLFTTGAYDTHPIKQQPSSGKKSFFYTNNNKHQKRVSNLQQSPRSSTSSQIFRSLNLEKLTVNRKQAVSAKRIVTRTKDRSLIQSKHHQLSQQVKEIINLV